MKEKNLFTKSGLEVVKNRYIDLFFLIERSGYLAMLSFANGDSDFAKDKDYIKALVNERDSLKSLLLNLGIDVLELADWGMQGFEKFIEWKIEENKRRGL